MNLITHGYSANASQAHSPISLPSAPHFHSSLHSSHPSFPIIAVAVVGILATAILLVSYYIFVIKCCLNWHRIDLLRHFSLAGNQPVERSFPVVESQGLDEAAIRSLPTFAFNGKDGTECAICLSKFVHDQKLRGIPNCSHAFHIDCIDVWLQSNANCPLCRTSISASRPETNLPLDRTDPVPQIQDSFGNEAHVVIEIRSAQCDSANPSLSRIKNRLNSGELLSPKNLDANIVRKNERKFGHTIRSVGDECIIDNRQKDEQFVVQPIRRSFSMDSAGNAELYLSVDEIISKHTQGSVHPVSLQP